MKWNKLTVTELGPYGEAIFNVLTFCAALGVLYWLISAGCTAAFEAIIGH